MENFNRCFLCSIESDFIYEIVLRMRISKILDYKPHFFFIHHIFNLCTQNYISTGTARPMKQRYIVFSIKKCTRLSPQTVPRQIYERKNWTQSRKEIHVQELPIRKQYVVAHFVNNGSKASNPMQSHARRISFGCLCLCVQNPDVKEETILSWNILVHTWLSYHKLIIQNKTNTDMISTHPISLRASFQFISRISLSSRSCAAATSALLDTWMITDSNRNIHTKEI